MTRECHARFYERRRVKLPPPTHHDRIDSQGWTIQLRDGVPWYTAPKWLDPTQTPQRNNRE